MSGDNSGALRVRVDDDDKADLLEMTSLEIRTRDHRTIKIPLNGNTLILRSSSGEARPATGGGANAANEAPVAPNEAQEEEDQDYLNNMRGWLVTVATLFVGIAFQAAMQPPAWMPNKPGDWILVVFNRKYARTVSSTERNQAQIAFLYQFGNMFILYIALTLVLLLLVMRKSPPGRVLWYVMGLIWMLSFAVIFVFILGITADSNISIGVFFTLYLCFVLSFSLVRFRFCKLGFVSSAPAGGYHASSGLQEPPGGVEKQAVRTDSTTHPSS